MIENNKSIIMDELLELMRNSRLNNKQKLKIIELIEEEKTATKKQKERFKLFYGLNNEGKHDIKLNQVAKECGCKPSAVKTSIFAMKCKLLKYEERFSVIENIVNECKWR